MSSGSSGPNGNGGNVANPGQTDPATDPVNASLKDYSDYLTGPGGLLERFGDIETKLKSQSEGTDASGKALSALASGNDPRFDAFKQGQFAQLAGEEKAQVGAGQRLFDRRGMGDSTASLNQTNRTQSSFAAQRMNLSGQLGMEQLGRQDSFLKASIDRQDAGTQGLGSALTTEAELKASPTALNIAKTAADNAGKGGDTGSSNNGLCCFIFLEARYGNGTMDKVVRRYRDEHMTVRNRRGYYRLAEVLVPLMRRYRLVKLLVCWTMTDPMVAYGKFYYGQNRWGRIFKPLTHWWLDLFDYLGGDHPFIRENGETV